jgi:hypothetical protein
VLKMLPPSIRLTLMVLRRASARHGLRDVLGWRSPTAATRRQHPHDVTGLQADRALVGQALGEALVATGKHPVLPHLSRASPLQAPRL